MKKIFAVSALAILALPALASAASAFTPYFGQNGLLSCTGLGGGTENKTCTSFCDLLKTGQLILRFLMTIAIYVVAPIFFLWGGVNILTAGGQEKRITEARQMMLDVVIGVVIIFAAFVIVNTFFYFFAKVIPPPSNPTNPNYTPQTSWSEIKCGVETSP